MKLFGPIFSKPGWSNKAADALSRKGSLGDF